jgi:hypothetical protein
MEHIIKFTEDDCVKLGQAIKESLGQVEKRFGLTISVDLSQREAGHVDFTVIGRPNKNFSLSPFAHWYALDCHKFALLPEWLGETFIVGERAQSEYKIVGLKPTNRKYPLIVQDKNGGQYKMSAPPAVEWFTKNPIKTKLRLVPMK